jgi:hypothetical protein
VPRLGERVYVDRASNVIGDVVHKYGFVGAGSLIPPGQIDTSSPSTTSPITLDARST